jgi:hypothetical protein
VNDGLLNPLPEKVWDLEEYVNACVPEQYRYYLLHQRGHADRFNWVGPDREQAKREKEQSIVEDLVAALYRDNCPYVSIESCEPPLPDCQLIDRAGQKTGVEVSELVDQATIERNTHTSYHCKVYSPEELFSATKAILIAKDRKLVRARAEIQRAGFGKIIVLLHCDEPDLNSRPAFCRKVLGSQDFQPLAEIDEAFLLLPCPRKKNLHDVEAEYCQPIRIPTPPRISAV